MISIKDIASLINGELNGDPDFIIKGACNLQNGKKHHIAFLDSPKFTKFIDNNIQLDAYRKNWRYGDGGKINVEESSFISEKNVISAKDKSSIFVSNSSFNHEIDHLKNRKVNIQNSLIFNNEL